MTGLTLFGVAPAAYAAPVSAGTLSHTAGNQVDFAEAALHECVNVELGQKPSAVITASQAASITNLGCWSKEISDLAGMEALTGLTELDLDDNKIVDLTPLAGLTSLKYLDLYLNDIVDLEPLAGLTSLEYLDVYNNQVVDVGPLAGLTSLGELGVAENSIVDISPLSALDAEVFARYQVVELGELEADVAAGNPIVDLNGDLVALDPPHDSAAHAFTPTKVGAGTAAWSNAEGYFAGTLNFTVVEQGASVTDGRDDGDEGTDVPVTGGDEGADTADAADADNASDVMGGGIVTAGLVLAGLLLVGGLIAGGVVIVRTRRKSQ